MQLRRQVGGDASMWRRHLELTDQLNMAANRLAHGADAIEVVRRSDPLYAASNATAGGRAGLRAAAGAVDSAGPDTPGLMRTMQRDVDGAARIVENARSEGARLLPITHGSENFVEQARGVDRAQAKAHLMADAYAEAARTPAGSPVTARYRHAVAIADGYVSHSSYKLRLLAQRALEDGLQYKPRHQLTGSGKAALAGAGLAAAALTVAAVARGGDS